MSRRANPGDIHGESRSDYTRPDRRVWTEEDFIRNRAAREEREAKHGKSDFTAGMDAENASRSAREAEWRKRQGIPDPKEGETRDSYIARVEASVQATKAKDRDR